MVENGWMKSVKAALLSGLVGLLGFVSEAEELTAYYQSGYIGDHVSTATDALKLTATSGGEALEYTNEHGEWTLIIDENTVVATAEAWCASTVKYNDLPINIVKVVIKRDFTFKPGVDAALFSGVELEVEQDRKLTLTKEGSRTMSLGAVTFSGDGEVDASSGVDFTKPITTKGNVTVKTPTNTFVANVAGTDYLTLQAAFDAAKPSGTITLLKDIGAISPVPSGLKDSTAWQGTLVMSGTMPKGFVPANYGNAKSTIEFKGVSGGYIIYTSLNFLGTIKLTNNGTTVAWTVSDGYSGDSWPLFFGALTGDGDLVDIGGAKQPFVFQDASKFSGSITANAKRFIVGDKIYSGGDGRIYVQSGYDLAVASKKSLKAANGIYVDGTIKGSGTLASATRFGKDAVIDLAEGSLTASGAVTFGLTLTLKNVKFGDTILKCASAPTNMATVKLKDEYGNEKPLWKLSYADGKVVFSDETRKLSRAERWTVTAAELSAVLGGEKARLDLSDYLALDQNPVILPVGTSKEQVLTFLNNLTVVQPTIRPNASLAVSGTSLALTYAPMTLYWAAWRGTFWEHIGQTDVNGNHGLMRDEAGNINIAHRPNDTVIFDREHYTSEDFWHWDENLYIKKEVVPGTSNEWDMKILEGVKLKLGFCGASASGQNLTQNFKIYVDEDSTLELGYWGNTHHKEGLLRENLTFGGAGTITLGDDMGASCRVKGDIKVAGGETPTLDVRGKELVVQGGQIDVNLTGFGALSGSGTITTPITFNNATINATDANGFTFKNKTTFTGTLTVDMARAPTDEELVKICTKGDGGSFNFTEGIDVLVRVNGSIRPAFYTLVTDTDGNLCVKVAPTQITYDAEVVLGYDYKTMICRVTMTPAIEGVVATVTVNYVDKELTTWSAPVVGMRGSGRAEVMVGDADDNFAPGTYSMIVSVGGYTYTVLNFTLAAQNDGNLATVDGVGYKTMREAVAAAEAARGTVNGTIKLLTNVFFAPPPGNYTIERGEYDIYITNDMEMSAQGSAVTIKAPEAIDHYHAWVGSPFVIEGNWLGVALPWKTRKEIQNTLSRDAGNDNGLKPYEAYVLGLPAKTWATDKPIAYGVQTNNPNTIELTDGLTTKSVEKTGVVVTKKLIDADTKSQVSATTVYDLSTMGGKAKLIKIGYSFTSDPGQTSSDVDSEGQ